MFLADWQIRERLTRPDSDPLHLRIEPFSEPVKRPGMISYGLSSFGYDVRVGDRYLVIPIDPDLIIDPLTFGDYIRERVADGRVKYHEGPECIIPPNNLVLAESYEWFRVPRDVINIVLGKSTYARCGITMTCTPLEPTWKGKITLEIANLTPNRSRIRSFQGIGQILFGCGESCAVSYADKAHASYQDQPGLTLPVVRT
jgi:dCTP deaminase